MTQAAEKLKVFISYSRSELAFVDQLEAALEAQGITTFVDREDIHSGEEWWKRIQQLIADADTVIFVLSPSSAASDICQKEVEFSENLNKRLVPIIAHELGGQAVPPALSRLNYIFFVPDPSVGASGDFDEALDRLVYTLLTDIVWIREHTRLGTLAQRWMQLNRADELVLRGSELFAAETWLTSRPQNAPIPTDAHQRFIAQSRRAATEELGRWRCSNCNSRHYTHCIFILAIDDRQPKRAASKRGTQQS